jgi:hypothetical protein
MSGYGSGYGFVPGENVIHRTQLYELEKQTGILNDIKNAIENIAATMKSNDGARPVTLQDNMNAKQLKEGNIRLRNQSNELAVELSEMKTKAENFVAKK